MTVILSADFERFSLPLLYKHCVCVYVNTVYVLG